MHVAQSTDCACTPDTIESELGFKISSAKPSAPKTESEKSLLTTCRNIVYLLRLYST
jgi:hypothetical protein